MKLRPCLAMAMLCVPGVLLAETGNGEKDSLLNLLDEQTALATKTRLNADYVPGIMSVLHGSDLELRGVRTVWEALALVPGIERAMESSGRRKLLVRGVGNIWGSGNVKLLLNSVAMNTAERGLANPLLNMPIEQVERIEVVRGPGSAVHGEFAYLGVINVITRSEEPRLFAFGGSNQTVGGGAVATWSEGEARVSASVSGWRTDGATGSTGPDLLHQIGLADRSNAPGSANKAQESGTAVVRLDHHDFSLLLQWNQDALGDYFGINDVLPPENRRIVERNRHRTIEARDAVPLSGSLSAEVFIGWQDALVERNRLYSGPAEYFYTTGPDIHVDSRYLEQKLYGGAEITWRASARHTLFAGLQTTDITVRESETRINLSPVDYSATDEPLVWDIGVPRGTGRTITSLTLQDEFRITDAFTLTTGLRHDDYDDVGERTTPRVAVVWRVDDVHIFKAQYAEAFRPPTLLELTTSARAATIRTSELGYVHKGVRWENRLTAFYSHLDDLVVIIEDAQASGFGNDSARAWGLEWEQRYDFSARFSVDGNVSYLETRDAATNRHFPGAPHWLANLGATYRSPVGMVWGAQVHHVGEMAREPADPRDSLAGYTTMDITATLHRLPVRGMSWSLGVKNLFNSTIRNPAGLDYVEDPDGVLTYPDDYPCTGREWWTRVSYDF